MKEYQKRVSKEKEELNSRVVKLQEFILSKEKFTKLSIIEQSLLKEQIYYMNAYLVVLEKRVSLFELLGK